jgi:hypothetical protein
VTRILPSGWRSIRIVMASDVANFSMTFSGSSSRIIVPSPARNGVTETAGPLATGLASLKPGYEIGSAGLLWAINGGKLAELHREWAVIERGNDKSRRIFHRRRQEEAMVTFPWAMSPR